MIKHFLLACRLAVLSPVLLTAVSGQIAVAEEKALWIDVRTEQEWDAGHLQNAVLIPYDQISSRITDFTDNKRQPINLYCRSGRRAEIALRTLEQMGFMNVQNLGSFQDLRARGHQ